MINSVLKFYGGDPLVAFLLTIAAVFSIAALIYVGGSAFLSWWRDREQARFAKQRKRFARIAQSNAESVTTWPPPPGPKGGPWRSKRAA